MLTNCDATIARESHVVYVSRVEWQDVKSSSPDNYGEKKGFSTSVFIYGKDDKGIKTGDFVIKGNHQSAMASLTGKAFMQYAKDNGGQVIKTIYDNTSERLPHIELGCAI